jgi:probable HAF family extracellular repeat protein
MAYSKYIAALVLGVFCFLLLSGAKAASASFIPLSYLEESDTLSFALGGSSDGSVVVGDSRSQAFRWTSNEGMVGLGFLPGGPGNYSEALDVSADGSIVVGNSVSALGDQPALWTSDGGMVGLGILPDGQSTEARSISADGNVVMGLENTASGGTEPWRWTSGTGIVGMGKKSSASGVSVVVGGSGSQAFRWTSNESMVGLGYLEDGMRSLTDILLSDGLDLKGWQLRYALGVSGGGRTVVGFGINPDGNNPDWRPVQNRLSRGPSMVRMEVIFPLSTRQLAPHLRLLFSVPTPTLLL